MKLQLETFEVAGTNVIINTNGAYSKMELMKLIVDVTTEFDKRHVRSPHRYGCNCSFV